MISRTPIRPNANNNLDNDVVAPEEVKDESGGSVAPVSRGDEDVESEDPRGDAEVDAEEEQGSRDMPEVDDEAQEEFRRQRRLRDPGQPTPE